MVGNLAAYLAVRLFVCLLQALRLETCRALATFLAWVSTDLCRVRGTVIDDNLRQAFPDMSPRGRRRLTRRMWEHLFLMVAEIAQAPRKIHRTNWRDYVSLENAAPILRAIFDGRPTLFVSAHFGNFELGGYMLGLLGFPTYSVARDLDNPYLHNYLQRFRGATGQHIVPKKGGYDEIVACLEQGRALGLLADQYAGSKGCWVNFFNRPASAHKAIALFALGHNAQVLVSAAVRRGGEPLRYTMHLHAATDVRAGGPEVGGVRELTQWYTSAFEEMIRQAPEQYWWLHRRWKDHRAARKASKAAKAA